MLVSPTVALAVFVTMVAASSAAGGGGAAPPDTLAAERAAMVASQIEARGVRDARVLHAMRIVPRHEFVPAKLRRHAYEDRPLPIGDGQTISQPYIVAAMTELAGAGPGMRVLEVGTGSGYQAAVLAATGAEVHSIEVVEALHARAAATLARLGYERVQLRAGDGRVGWPEAAPFDAIVVTAAAEAVPPALLEQLADGGRLVIPVGHDHHQVLEVHRRSGDTVVVEHVFPVAFVPLVGGPRRP
jgi:protein-L-isoaspartate(D-aspartate) O-methyltransferase